METRIKESRAQLSGALVHPNEVVWRGRLADYNFYIAFLIHFPSTSNLSIERRGASSLRLCWFENNPK